MQSVQSALPNLKLVLDNLDAPVHLPTIVRTANAIIAAPPLDSQDAALRSMLCSRLLRDHKLSINSELRAQLVNVLLEDVESALGKRPATDRASRPPSSSNSTSNKRHYRGPPHAPVPAGGKTHSSPTRDKSWPEFFQALYREWEQDASNKNSWASAFDAGPFGARRRGFANNNKNTKRHSYLEWARRIQKCFDDYVIHLPAYDDMNQLIRTHGGKQVIAREASKWRTKSTKPSQPNAHLAPPPVPLANTVTS